MTTLTSGDGLLVSIPIFYSLVSGRAPQLAQTLNVPHKMAPVFLAGTASVVLNDHAGYRNQLEPCGCKAQANVNVFAIHEVRRVKALQALVHTGLEQHEGPIDPNVGRWWR